MQIDVLPSNIDMTGALQAVKNARRVLTLCHAVILAYLADHSRKNGGPCECAICQEARMLL